jgi:uncharacterized protein (TIGR00369 family)
MRAAGADGSSGAASRPDNPDRALLERAIREGLAGVRFDANPIAQAMGTVLESASPGRVRLGYEIGPQFCQGGGVVQGGIQAAMLDFGMAFAALTTVAKGESVASVGINVVYLRVALPGRYRVEAWLEKTGRRMAFARAELALEGGEVVASASSPITILR